MTKKILSQLIIDLAPKSIFGSMQIPVTGLTNDSREVKGGSVFIAVPGHRTDGHHYIPAAMRAGAAAVVAQHPTPGIAVPQVIVENSRLAQATLATKFYDNPSYQLKLTGITGTNGKTTCTFMLDSILKTAKVGSGLMGTLYNKVGGKILPTANTTPDSILCQRLLQGMVAAGATHATMEVSSHAMVMHRISKTRFSVGGITNFSPDHLDLHQNMADYLRAKKSFFDMLPADGYAVINGDEPACRQIAHDTPATKLYYSLSDPMADLYLSNFQRRGSGAIITVSINSQKVPTTSREIVFYLAVSGRHNIANALLAAGAGLALGIEIPTIARGLGAFRGIFRRFETIYNKGYRVIDDATHNPANMDVVFQAVSADRPSSVSVVYAIRGNRGVDINRSLASTLRHWSQRLRPHSVVITRCDDTASPMDQVKPEEEAAFRVALAGANTDIHFTTTLRQAIGTALESIQPGATLLLLGAHPMDNVSQVFSELAGVPTSTLPRPPEFGVH